MNLERFMKVYSNLPINLRKEVVIVIDKEPISWNVARNEIEHNTKLGKKILKKLIPNKKIFLLLKNFLCVIIIDKQIFFLKN